MVCTLKADDVFGPAVGQGCRNDFDFTLLFEQCLLQIPPCAILLLLGPLRASQLRTQSVKVLRNGVRDVKQLANLVLAATQLALLILWSLTPMYRTRASIPAAVLSFLASLSLIYLSSIEHSRSVRPSSLINAYIFFSLLFDIPQARTLWLRPGPRALPAIFTAGFAAKMMIFCLEALNKRSLLFPPFQLLAPEALVSLYSRTMLWWINPLFFQGYRNTLSTDRLYEVDPGLKSDHVERSFVKAWSKQSKASKRAMLWATMHSVKGPFFAMVIPRLYNGALKLSQALFINRVTTVLSQKQDAQSERIGWGLTGAAALIYTGMAVTDALYQRQVDRLTTKTRGIIITAVYSKSLHVASDKLADNAALTLISADVERICISLQRIIELFATPLEVAAAIFLLERQIGVACVAPVALTIIIATSSFFNSNASIEPQKRWLEAISKRVAYTSAVLNCPKGFKLLGLTNYFKENIQSLRVFEMVQYAHYRKYVTWRNVFSYIPTLLAPALALVVFTLVEGQRALDPTVAFTALSLVDLMTEPIASLIHAVPMLQTVIACLERIQDFLLLEDDGLFDATGDGTNTVRNQSNATIEAVELSDMRPAKSHFDGPETCISIQEGSVSLGIEGKQVLRGLSFRIKRRGLSLIVGPIGSGKSILLKAIIGDIPLSNGSRNVLEHNNFSFCAQDPWLPNETVKDLICGYTNFDSEWYCSVKRACALVPDIAAFPEGDDSLIGTKGVSLSGGQRQRLALARAIYARQEILIADDVLSGLDMNTSKQVFSQVFGRRGLCQTQGMTVVFATHARQYLHEADYIIALSEHGTIEEQGTFGQLENAGGYVHRLKTEYVDSSEDAQGDEAFNERDSKAAPSSATELADLQADLARRTGDVSVYGYYIRSCGWKLTTIFVLCALGYAFGATFPSVWVQWWSEAEATAVTPRPPGLWIGVYLFIVVFGIISDGAQIWTMLVHAVPRSSAQLHKQILEAVMHAKYSLFSNTDSGVTLNRFSNDMALIEGPLAGALLQFSSGIATAAGSAALIAIGADFSAAAVPAILLVLYVIQRFYLRTSRQLRNLELEAQAPLITHCSETLAGVTTIRAFGWQHHAHQKLLDRLDASQRPYYLLLCIQRWLKLVLALVTAAFAVIVVAMATQLPYTSSAGAIGVSLLNVLSFSSILSLVVSAWTTVETSLGAVARCKNFEVTTNSEDRSEESHRPDNAWPERGRVQISNLFASYTADGQPALDSISLNIAAGEKIGICGRSGSGKSSLLLTLFRLLDHSSGSITVDGIDLSTMPRQVTRESFCALPQETISFPGTLLTNLDPLGLATEADAARVLETTGLLDLVMSRGGLQVELSSLGLSQGQMQLFAVARALLRKSKLVVLDEMTSSVDSITEETMLRIIRDEFSESTVIAVAHRLKTIVDFDRIVVLDSGRIVEMGRPHELLTMKNGMFRALWERSGEH